MGAGLPSASQINSTFVRKRRCSCRAGASALMVGASEEQQILIREARMDFVDLCHVSRLYSLLAWSLNFGNCVLIFELFLPAALGRVTGRRGSLTAGHVARGKVQGD